MTALQSCLCLLYQALTQVILDANLSSWKSLFIESQLVCTKRHALFSNMTISIDGILLYFDIIQIRGTLYFTTVNLPVT